MDRRAFLKKAGIGTVALASLPALINSLAASARGDDDEGVGKTNFQFLSFSKGSTVAGVDHRIVMGGEGTVEGSEVEGGGSFVHFDNASAVPKTILASGTWKAKRLLDFKLIGTWGAFSAGNLEMEVELVRDFPSPGVIKATLEQICNIGAAGLSTGEEEGFMLTIPGVPFSPFVPVIIGGVPLGITAFTMGKD